MDRGGPAGGVRGEGKNLVPRRLVEVWQLIPARAMAAIGGLLTFN
jgi:hypothetical protein